MTKTPVRPMLFLAVGLAAYITIVTAHASSAGDAWFDIAHGSFVYRVVEADRPLVRALQPLADRAWERITVDLGGAPRGPITVVLAPTNEAFNQFQPFGEPLPEWAVGVAYPGTMTMVIRSYHVAGTSRQDVGAILVHELTHLVLGAWFGAQPIPFWLHEGLAMYEAGEWDPGHEWDLVRVVLANRVPRLDALTAAHSNEADVRTAYALSEALVGHMIATYGAESFGLFVNHLAQGRPFEDALIRGFHVTPERFEAQWRAHLDRRYTWIPLVTGSGALWVLVMAAAFAAYAAKKRRNRKIAAAWAEEERANE